MDETSSKRVYVYKIGSITRSFTFLLAGFFALGGLFNIVRVMRKYLRSNPIFQWSHYASSVGIVFRVCSKNKLYVQRQPKFESANLNISFLQDVEKSHLNSGLQIR